jgi:outer membrane biosynthesis protein TonB
MKKTTLILGAVGVAMALACGGGDEEATPEPAAEEPVEEAAEEPAEEPVEEAAEEPEEEPKTPATTRERKGGKGKMKGKSSL